MTTAPSIKSWGLIGFLAAFVFGVDLVAPLGVAVALLYVAIVLLGAGLPRRCDIFLVASGASVLTISGFLLSGGDIVFLAETDTRPALINHTLTLLAIWATAFLSARRRAAESELSTLTEAFTEILDNTQSLYYRIDKEGRSIEARGSGLVTLGLQDFALEDLNVFELYPEFRVQFEKVLAGGTASFESHGENDGRPWWFLTHLVFDERRGEGAIGFAFDITEQKLTEQALRNSEERFRGSFDGTTAGMCALGPNGKIEYCNRAITELLGYSERELQRMTPLDFMHPDDLAGAGQSLRKVFSGEIESYRAERRFVRKNGEQIWTDASLSSIRNADGKVIEVSVFLTDITESKATAEALSSLSTEQELLLENTHAAIFLTKGPYLVRANRYFEELYGHKVREGSTVDPKTGNPVLARYDEMGFLDEDDFSTFRKEAFNALRNEGNYRAERRMRRPDGEPFWARFVAKPVEPGSLEKGIIWLVEDFTEERTARDDLRRANEELEARVDERTAELTRQLAERDRAEKALAASEEKFRALTENTTEVTIILDADGAYTYVSPSIVELVGIPVGEFLGHKPAHFIHPDDAPIFEAVIEEAINEPGTTFITPDIRVQRADGKIIYLEARSTSMLDVSGVRGVVVNAHDVTARRRAEMALRESEAKYRGFMEQATDGVLIVDLKGHILEANQRACEVMGCEREQFLESNAIAFYAPSEGRDDADAFAELHAGGTISVERQVRRADGTIFPAEIHARLLDGDWVIGRVIGIVRDITDRKRAEEALRESEERYRGFVEALPNAVLVLDREEVLFANQATLNLLGFDMWGEVVGKSLLEFLHESEREGVLNHLTAARRSIDFDESLETKICRADGEEVNIELGARRIMFRGRPATMAVVHDVTDRIRNEFALRYAKDQAEVANTAKSAFLSSMSHELRTPMNAILGFTQLLQQDQSKVLDGEHRIFVDQIFNAGKYLLALIDDVLSLEKIETGNATVTMEPLDPRDLIDQCLAVVQASADNMGITVVDETCRRELPLIWADETAFKQVLINLLSNGIKYNKPEGTVRLSVELDVFGELQINVHDNGHGIPIERQKEVFEPFNRLGAENSSIEGTGIGLTITKRQMDLMHGELWFNSKPGQGTTFSIKFRTIANKTVDHIKDNETANFTDGEAGETRVVLYVEDNEASVALMEHIIGGSVGWRLVTAGDAESALEIVRRDPPDVILMDINLPGMNGFEAVRRLSRLESGRDVPVIAVSANAMPEDISRARRAGFQNYLTKPVVVADVLTAIDAAFSWKQAAG